MFPIQRSVRNVNCRFGEHSGLRYSTVSQWSYHGDLRRNHERRNFLLPMDLNERFLKFREHLGCEIKLNWKLIRYGIAPQGMAFRNLFLRFLIMHADAKSDSSKALHITAPPTYKQKFFFTKTPPIKSVHDNTFQDVPLETFQRLMAGITRHISESPSIFVTDGSAGSHRLAQTNIRSISCESNGALYLHHLLSPSPGNMENFNYNTVVYHAPNFFPDNERHGIFGESIVVLTLLKGETVLSTYSNDKLSDISEEEQIEFAKREAAVLILCGNVTQSQYRNALTVVSDYIHIREGRVPLDASVIRNQSGKTAIVFDPNNILLNGRIFPDLFSACNSVWTENGLYRTFKGVTHNNESLPRIPGDLVENSDGTLNITQPLTRYTTEDLYANPPSAIIYLLRDPSGVIPPLGRLQNTSAPHFWKKGYDGNNFVPYFRNRPLVEPQEGALFALFEALLRKFKPQVYVINVSGKGDDLSNTNLDNILTSILDGSADQAVVQSIKGLEIGSINKLPNVDQRVLNRTKGWKSKEEYQDAAIKLGSKLGISS